MSPHRWIVAALLLSAPALAAQPKPLPPAGACTRVPKSDGGCPGNERFPPSFRYTLKDGELTLDWHACTARNRHLSHGHALARTGLEYLFRSGGSCDLFAMFLENSDTVYLLRNDPGTGSTESCTVYYHCAP